MILIRSGRHAEALAALEESRALPPEVFGVGDAILRSGLQAEAHRALGDAAAARSAADETLALIRKNPPIVSYTLEGYAGAAETYLAAWEAALRAPSTTRPPIAAAWRSIASLRKLARVYPVALPRARLLLGKARWLAGHQSAARRAWRSARFAAERLAMPFERALALREVARHLEPDDPGRLAIVAEARAAFEALGLGPGLPSGPGSS